MKHIWIYTLFRSSSNCIYISSPINLIHVRIGAKPTNTGYLGQENSLGRRQIKHITQERKLSGRISKREFHSIIYTISTFWTTNGRGKTIHYMDRESVSVCMCLCYVLANDSQVKQSMKRMHTTDVTPSRASFNDSGDRRFPGKGNFFFKKLLPEKEWGHQEKTTQESKPLCQVTLLAHGSCNDDLPDLRRKIRKH